MGGGWGAGRENLVYRFLTRLSVAFSETRGGSGGHLRLVAST